MNLLLNLYKNGAKFLIKNFILHKKLTLKRTRCRFKIFVLKNKFKKFGLFAYVTRNFWTSNVGYFFIMRVKDGLLKNNFN